VSKREDAGVSSEHVDTDDDGQLDHCVGSDTLTAARQLRTDERYHGNGDD
jgi:hypothetical protein